MLVFQKQKVVFRGNGVQPFPIFALVNNWF
jgi:hypothetical protein